MIPKKFLKMKKGKKIAILAGIAVNVVAVITVLLAIFIDFTPKHKKPEDLANSYDDAYFSTLISNQIDVARIEYSPDATNNTCTVTGFNLNTSYTPDDFKKTLRIPNVIDGYTVTEINFTTMDNAETNMALLIRAIIIPTTVQRIEEASFFGFGSLEYFETPFIGIERGSSGYGMARPDIDKSYPIGSMFSQPFEGNQYQGFDFDNNPVVSREIQWYEVEPKGAAACTFMMPGNLQRIVVTDETVIGNHALYSMPMVSSIIIRNPSTLDTEGLRFGFFAVADNENLVQLNLPTHNVSLGNGTFGRNPKLPKVTLPAGIIEIPDSTFELCEGLEEVDMPATVQTIGAGAFLTCSSLNKINLFSETIGDLPSANGHDVNFPSGLVSIGQHAFRGCMEIKELYLPDDVEYIGAAAFDGCIQLELISLPFVGAHKDGHKEGYCKESDSDYKYHSLFGYIFGQNGSVGEGTYLAEQTYAADSSTQFAIPSSLKTININNETKIDVGALQNLSSVTLLTLNDGITSIAQGSMFGMSKLAEISVPFIPGNSLGYMFADLFNGSKPFSAYQTTGTYRVPNNLGYVKITNQPVIRTSTFANCTSLVRLEVSEKTNLMEEAIFYNNPHLETLVLPFVGRERGEVGSVHYPNGIHNDEYDWWWRDKAWRNTLQWLFSSSRHNATYENNSLRWYDDYRKYIPLSLQNVTITDESVIGTYSFRNFSSLTSVAITNDVSWIAESALVGCPNIKNLTIPYVGANANPSGANGYDHVLGWIFGRSYYNGSYPVSQYSTFYIPNALTNVRIGDVSSKIPAYAFNDCETITNISTAAEIVELGTGCFANCINLGQLSMPNASYTTVADYAFQNCRQIQDMYKFIPTTVNRINSYGFAGTSVGYGDKEIDLSKFEYVGPYAFSNCLQIKSVTLPDGTVFGEGVFAGDQYLKSVDLSKNHNVTAYMFKNCTSLEGIDFSEVKVIPNGIFQGCSSLKYSSDGVTGFVQSDQTTSIGDYAFYGCQSFDNFEVYPTTTSIGSFAFSGCTGIPYMTIPKETTTIKPNGWVGCNDNFFFYVYEPEDKWSSGWVDNWNCDYPVYIIGDIDDSKFTYRYDTKYKKYFVTGTTSGTVLYGTVKIPASHNGIKVIGVDDTNPDDIDRTEGERRISDHPHLNKIILPKSVSIIKGTPFANGHRVDVYTELTEKEVDDLYVSTNGEQGWEIYETDGIYRYTTEDVSAWTTAGLLYYKDYWKYGTGVAAGTPYILSSALTFHLNENLSYTYTGSALEPGIESIDIPAVININDDLEVTTDMLTIPQDHVNIFDYYYANNISVGTARITAKINNTELDNKNRDYSIFQQNFPMLLTGDATIKFVIEKAVINLYIDSNNQGTNFMDRYCTSLSMTYNGNPWRNSDWGTANVQGLYEVFPNTRFTGTLATVSSEAETYLASTLAGQSRFRWETDWKVTRNNMDISSNFTVIVNLKVTIIPMDVTIEFTGGELNTTDNIYEYPYIGEYITPTAQARQYRTDGITGAIQKNCPVSAFNFDEEGGFYPGTATFGMYAKLNDEKNYRLVDENGAPLINNVILGNSSAINGVEGKYRVVKGKIYINFNYTDYVISPNADYWSNTKWDSTNMSGLGPNSVFEGKMISSGDAKTSYTWGDKNGYNLLWQITTGTKGYSGDYHIYNEKYSTTPDKGSTADETQYYDVIVNDSARVQINYNKFNVNYYVGLDNDPNYETNRQKVPTSISIDQDNGRYRIYIEYEVDGEVYRLTVGAIDENGNLYSDDVNSPNYLRDYSIKYYTDFGASTTISPLTFRDIRMYRIAVQIDARHFDTYFANVELNAIKSNVKFDNLTREYNGEAMDPFAENKVLKYGQDQNFTLTYYNANVNGDPIGAALESAPIHAGRYTVHVVATEGEFFNSMDQYIAFEIEKRRITIDLSAITVLDAVTMTTNAGWKHYDQTTVSYTPDNMELHTIGSLLSTDELTGVLYTASSDAGIYDENRMSWVPNWQIFTTATGADVTSDYTIILTNEFEIKPLQFVGDPNLGFSDGYDDYYDGLPKYIEMLVTYPTKDNYYPAPNGDYTIYYSLSPITASTDLSTCSKLNYPFSSPGEYTVYYAIVKDNFETVYGSDTVKIKEKTIQYHVSPDSGTFDGVDTYTVDYNGYLQPFKIEIDDPWYANVYYSLDGENWTNTYYQYQEKGVYEIYYKIEAPFYTTVGPERIFFIIAEPTQELPTDFYSIDPFKGGYDGNEHSVDVSVTKPAGSAFSKISYSTDHGDTWTEEAPVYTEAGTYPVVVRIICQGYKTIYAPVEIEIYALEMHIDVQPYKGVYDGEYHNAGLTLSSSASIDETLTQDDSGVYYYNGLPVTYSYTTSSNVVDADTGWIQSIIYDTDGNIVAKNLGFKNVSKNQVWVKLSVPNYRDTVLGYVMVEITVNENPFGEIPYQEIQYKKAEMTKDDIKINTIHDGVYSLYFYTALEDSDGNLYYDPDTCHPIPAPQELGNYYVVAEFNPSRNCVAKSYSGTFKIVKRKLEVKWDNEFYYDGWEKDPAPYVISGTSDQIDLIYQIEGPEPAIEIGTYYYQVTMRNSEYNKNYEISPTRIDLTIKKMELLIQFEAEKVATNPPTPWTQDDCIEYYNPNDPYAWRNLGLPLLNGHMFIATMETSSGVKTNYYYTTLDNQIFINKVNVEYDIIRVDRNYNPILDTDGNTISVKEFYDVDFDIVVRIVNPSIDLENIVQDTIVTYDGYPHSIQLNLPDNLSGALIFYKTEDGGYYRNPITYTLAGIYETDFYIRYRGYEDTYGTARLIIEKADLDIEIDQLPANNNTYDGNEHKTTYHVVNNIYQLPQATGEYGHVKYYSAEDYTYDEINDFYANFTPYSHIFIDGGKDSIKDAGKYYCVVYYNDTVARWNASYAVQEIELKQKDIRIDFTYDIYHTPIYNGEKFYIPLTNCYIHEEDLLTGHIIPSAPAVTPYTVRTNSANAGIYDPETGFEFGAMRIMEGTTNVAKNYHPVLSAPSFFVKILKADLTDDTFIVEEMIREYDGKVASPKITTPSDGEIYYYFQYYVDGGGTLDCTPTNYQTGVNHYFVGVTIGEGTNYNAWSGGYKYADVTIVPKNVTIEWSDTEVTFNGEKQAPTAVIVDKETDPENEITVPLLVQFFVGADLENGVINAGAYEAIASFDPAMPDYSDYVLNYTFENSLHTFTVNKLYFDLQLGDGESSNNIVSYNTESGWSREIKTVDTRNYPEIIDFLNEKLVLGGGFGSSYPFIRTARNTIGVYDTYDDFIINYSCHTLSGIDVTDSIDFNIIGRVTLFSNDITFTTEDKTFIYEEGTEYTFNDLKCLNILNPLSASITQFKTTYQKDEYTTPIEGELQTFLSDPATGRESLSNAGTYTIQIWIDAPGYTTKIASVTIEILPKESYIAFSTSLSKTYDGTPVDPTRAINTSASGYNGIIQDLEYQYAEGIRGADGIIEYSLLPAGEVPKDAGLYRLYVTSSKDSEGLPDFFYNYTTLYKEEDFEIRPKSVDITYPVDIVLSRANNNLNILGQPWLSNLEQRTAGNSNLISGDMLEFQVKSDFNLRRGKYETSTIMYYENNHEFTLVDRINTSTNDTFTLSWYVYRTRSDGGKELDADGRPIDITKNYYLKFYFNLDVHYPYIPATITGGDFIYDGQPHHATADITNVSSDLNLVQNYTTESIQAAENGVNCVNNIELLEFTEPGRHRVYYCLTADDSEPLKGYVDVVITKMELDETTQKVPDKVYDGQPAGVPYTGSSGTIYYPDLTLGTSVEFGKQLLNNDPSILASIMENARMEYQLVGTNQRIDGSVGVTKAGTYEYLLVIPETEYFQEKICTGRFEILQATIYIVDDPSITLSKTYDGRVGTYAMTDAYTDPYFMLCTDKNDPANSSIFNSNLLLTATLVTKQANAKVYTGKDASLDFLYQSYKVTTLFGDDVTENYVVNLEACTYTIEHAEQEIIDTTPTEIVYDGFAHTVSFTMIQPTSLNHSTVYYKNHEGKFVTDRVYYTDANEVGQPYEIEIRIVTPNYKDYETTLRLNIVQAESVVRIGDNMNQMYNGQEVTLPSAIYTNNTDALRDKYSFIYYKLESDGIYHLIWELDGETGTANGTRPINAGKYKVEVRVPGTKNYRGGSDEAEFEIMPLPVNIKWTDTTIDYDGKGGHKPQAYLQVSQADAEKGIVVPLKISAVPATSTADAELKSVGAYLATAEIDTDVYTEHNYTIIKASKSCTYSIIPKKVTIHLNQGASYSASCPTFTYNTTSSPAAYTYDADILSTHTMTDVLVSKNSEVGTYVGTYNFTWQDAAGNPILTPRILDENSKDVTFNYNISYDLRLVINTSEIIYTVDDINQDYDGADHQFDVTVTTVGNFKIEYLYPGETVYTETRRIYKDVVNDTIHFRITDLDGIFTTVTGVVHAIIRAKDARLEIADLNPLSREYNAEPYENPSVTYADMDTITRTVNYTYYQKVNGQWIAVPNNTVIDAGEYKVHIEMDAVANYTNGAKDFEFEIYKRDLTITSYGTLQKSYDGSLWSVDINTAVAAKQIDLKGLITDNGHTHTMNGKLQTISSNFGDYKVAERFNWENGYKIYDENNQEVQKNYNIIYNVDVEITKAQMEVVIQPYDKPYDGSAHPATVDVIGRKQILGYDPYGNPITTIVQPGPNATIYYHDENSDEWTTNIPTLLNVGYKEVYVKITAPNYEDFYSQTYIRITNGTLPTDPDINKPTPDPDDPNLIWAQNYVYDGNEYPKPYYLPDEGGQNVVYYLATDTGKTNPLTTAPIDAGKYVFVLTVPGKSDPIERNFEIRKREVTLSWTDTYLPENGNPQLPTASFIDVNNNTVSSATSDISLASAQTNRGSYTVTATLGANYSSNYTIKNPTTTFNIYDPNDPNDPFRPQDPDGPTPDPLDPNLLWDQNYIYNGIPYTDPTYTTTLAGSHTVVYYDAADTAKANPLPVAPTNAGYYVFVISGPGIENPLERNFQIKQRDIELTWTKTMVPFTNDMQIPIATFTDVFGSTISSETSPNFEVVDPHSAAGTYEVTATFTGDYAINYRINNPTHEFKIGVTEVDEFVLYDPLVYMYGEEVIIKDSAENTYVFDENGKVTDILNPAGDSIYPTDGLLYDLVVDFDPKVGFHAVIAQLKDPSNCIWKTKGDNQDLEYKYEITPITFPNDDYLLVVYLDSDVETYTGEIIKPTPHAKLVKKDAVHEEIELTLGTDFKANYPGEDNDPDDPSNWDRTNIDVTTKEKAKVFVTGIGNYSFSETKEFSIISGIPQLIKIKSEGTTIQFITVEYVSEYDAEYNTTLNYVKITEDGTVTHTTTTDKNLYIGHLHQDTFISDIIKQLDNESKYLEFVSYTQDVIAPEDYETTYVGTGMTVRLYDDEDFTQANLLDEITFILYGDLDGDGMITQLDFIVINNITSNLISYDSLYLDGQEYFYYAGITQRNPDNINSVSQSSFIDVNNWTSSLHIDFNSDFVIKSTTDTPTVG